MIDLAVILIGETLERIKQILGLWGSGVWLAREL